MHETAPDLRVARFLGPAVALAALGTLVWALARGFEQTVGALGDFDWRVYPLVLLTTLVNYGLRYLKWHLLLQRVGVSLTHAVDLRIFLSGLAMVISPGKAGELLKPWLVRRIHGAPMAVTVPVLVAERATDGIAVILLTAVGVTTYAQQAGFERGADFLLTLTALLGVGLLALGFKPVVDGVLSLVERVPVVSRAVPKIREATAALRTCLSPGSLLAMTVLSVVAWWAECVGCWYVLRGMGTDATLGASTFLYAGATVLGGPSPGGLGVADVALAEGAVRLVPGLTPGAAVAASLLVRVATLWFGVAIGALLLLRLPATLPEAAPKAGG